MSKLKRIRHVSTMRAREGFLFSVHTTVGYQLTPDAEDKPAIEALASYFPELQAMLDNDAKSIMFTPDQHVRALAIQEAIITRANQHRTFARRDDYALPSVRKLLETLGLISVTHSRAC